MIQKFARGACCCVLLVSPILAHAQDVSRELACNFTVECILGEACAETTFDLALTVDHSKDGNAVSGKFSTDWGDEDVAGLHETGAFSLSGRVDASVSHHITISPNGSAVYTNHISSEMSITYSGVCS